MSHRHRLNVAITCHADYLFIVGDRFTAKGKADRSARMSREIYDNGVEQGVERRQLQLLVYLPYKVNKRHLRDGTPYRVPDDEDDDVGDLGPRTEALEKKAAQKGTEREDEGKGEN